MSGRPRAPSRARGLAAPPDGYHRAVTTEPPPALGVTRDEPLARHTYMRAGGPAEYFATPAELEALTAVLGWARERGLVVRVLGGGSNLIVADEGVRGLVISLRRCGAALQFEGTSVTAGAGVMLPALARAAAEHDLGGLEFAIGIPGSVGGALQTNAGIGDGRAIGPLVRSVHVFEAGFEAGLDGSPDGLEVRALDRGQLAFRYRDSSLRESGLVVLDATLDLVPRPRAEVEAETRRLLEARQASQPTAERNAGSIFRNPPDDHAGRLIEAAGCKGLRVGGARVSERHANFIVLDAGGATRDLVALMARVQTTVRERFEVWLQPEVEWWGDGDAPAPWQDASEAR